MKGETKLILGFAALLICGTGWFMSCSVNAPSSATVQFSQARLESNGSLKVDYDYTTPSGTVLHETDSINGAKTAESYGNGGGLANQSPSGSSYHIAIPDVPSPPPSMLVTTGKIYYLKPSERLPIYNFTNNSGKAYRGELSLEQR